MNDSPDREPPSARSLAHPSLRPRVAPAASLGSFGYHPMFYVVLLGVATPGFVLVLGELISGRPFSDSPQLTAAVLLLLLFFSVAFVVLVVPHRLLVSASSVTAIYLNGRRRSWPRHTLSRRHPPDPVSRLFDAIPIQDHSGAIVFRILTNLVEKDAFLRLIDT